MCLEFVAFWKNTYMVFITCLLCLSFTDCICFADGDEDLWPTDLSDNNRPRHIPSLSKTLPADTGNLRRSLSSKKIDSALYGMAAMIAGVGAGFDIRLSNKTGIHPDVEGAMDIRTTPKRDSFILNRRDAYNAAVRDLFLEPEMDFKSYYSAASGGLHHTYHGHQTKYRPSVQNIPIRFADRNSLVEDHHSNDEEDSSSTMKSTSTLVPRVSPTHRLSIGESDDGTLTNSSQEGYLYSHYGVQRQLSESSYSSDASRTTVRSNRHSVTFEDEFNPANIKDDKFKSPSDTSNNASPFHETAAPVAPPRRHKVNGGPPERPKTLDLASSKHGILKQSSSYSSQDSSRESPRSTWVTPSESGEHTPYFSTRSRMSPGNTPPHILHQKTLLDIDMDGQNLDTTQPLIQPKSQRRPTVQELEQEFNKRL